MTVAPVTGMTRDEAARHLTETDPMLALGTVELRGVTYPYFRNAPVDVRGYLQSVRPMMDDGAADFLVYRDERWSFDAFLADVDRMAGALAGLGVTNGTRVALGMRNYPEILILMCAIAAAGGIVVFLNAWWTTEELDYALEDSGARLVLADGQRVERLLPLRDARDLTIVGVREGEELTAHGYTALNAENAARPEVHVDPDDDFGIMYSSGTTGHPKGVVLTHRATVHAGYSHHFQAMMAPLITPPEPDAPEPPRPAALIITPLFHVTATHAAFFGSLLSGSKITLMYKWDAEEAVRVIDTEQVTKLVGVPTQTADLMEAARRMGQPLPSLRFLAAGGAKRPAAQVGPLAETFPTAAIASGWGMTETSSIGIGLSGPEYVEHPGAAGRMHLPLQELRIVDDSGNQLPDGEVGEIAVKSVCNMRGYLNKPEATAEVLKDGFMHTGDLGYVDDTGLVTIVDRKKNIIIRGGENIACLDVEGALHMHPDVLEACAFPLPHERLGETVGAGVQLRAGSTVSQEDLRVYLKDHIAHYKVPDRIWCQPGPLPRGATDKIDRRGLRATCLNALTKEETA
ncbi:class I adenylate-forming enzyme family protein [Chachezhania antarctica]|uniref:class I adenylate-forming enzyme family protein n=1 Tax=Chachezhania antarctica TaxID=2340860 RepID=UPI001F08E6CD|nr:class I adenylate-forming enzyme family protein [Chachezhania antarctica]|tara:strand:- start:6212 stop:7930 length:1719 start_codon:yes stop_codon:yes gene_type:complete